jgi:hypothetical protein
MPTENSLHQYTLVLAKEAGIVRFGRGEIKHLGQSMKVSSLQVVIDRNEEYLLLKIPLHYVQIDTKSYSEPSEPLDKP